MSMWIKTNSNVIITEMCVLEAKHNSGFRKTFQVESANEKSSKYT